MNASNNKLIIAGGRFFDDYELMKSVLANIKFDFTVISGRARGADKLGERYAEEFGKPVELYPADWDTHGKRAGYLRNEQMAEVGTHLVAFWDGESKGTKHMIDIATRKGLKVVVVKY